MKGIYRSVSKKGFFLSFLSAAIALFLFLGRIVSGHEHDGGTKQLAQTDSQYPAGSVEGVPVKGVMGVRRTTAAINDAQRMAPSSSGTVSRSLYYNKEVISRPNRLPNPEAKPVASLPEPSEGDRP